MIQFTVYGVAKPAGSKRAFIRRNKAGKLSARVVDANPNSGDWKNYVAVTAAPFAGDELLTGALTVAMKFYIPRPKSHYGTGRNAKEVKASSRQWPIGPPDVLKLARGIEDSLSSVLWRDDAQIVSESLVKCYGEPARVEIYVGVVADNDPWAHVAVFGGARCISEPYRNSRLRDGETQPAEPPTGLTP